MLMIMLDVCNHARKWGYNVRRIQAPPHSGLPNDEIAILFAKVNQRHDRHEFKEGWSKWPQLHVPSTQRLHYREGQSRDIFFRNACAIYLDPFRKRDQVRRSK